MLLQKKKKEIKKKKIDNKNISGHWMSTKCSQTREEKSKECCHIFKSSQTIRAIIYARKYP